MWCVQAPLGQFQAIRSSHGQQAEKKTHVYFGHHSLQEDVDKSKFTGICRQWSVLGQIVQKMADSEQDPYNMWVHQRTPEGVHKFGFRYTSVLPNGVFSGLFYADGRIWYHNWITAWYSEIGEFSMMFKSGPGMSEGDTREWKRSSTPLTDQQIGEYSRGIFFGLGSKNYLYIYLNVNPRK